MNDKLNTVEEKINDFGNIAIETIQNEIQSKKEWKEEKTTKHQ